MDSSWVYWISHFNFSHLIRSGGAGCYAICLPYRGIAEAEGRGAGEAPPAGGESQTGGGASQSSLPAAVHRDWGAIPHRALYAAATTAGGHRHSDTLQVMTMKCFQLWNMLSDLGNIHVQQTIIIQVMIRTYLFCKSEVKSVKHRKLYGKKRKTCWIHSASNGSACVTSFHTADSATWSSTDNF